MPVLDPHTLQPQPFPYQKSKYSTTLIEDADGLAVFSMCNSNQQGIVTRDFILETLNDFTEAEALALIDVRVFKALEELRAAVAEATKVEEVEVAA